MSFKSLKGELSLRFRGYLMPCVTLKQFSLSALPDFVDETMCEQISTHRIKYQLYKIQYYVKQMLDRNLYAINKGSYQFCTQDNCIPPKLFLVSAGIQNSHLQFCKRVYYQLSHARPPFCFSSNTLFTIKQNDSVFCNHFVSLQF